MLGAGAGAGAGGEAPAWQAAKLGDLLSHGLAVEWHR